MNTVGRIEFGPEQRSAPERRLYGDEALLARAEAARKAPLNVRVRKLHPAAILPTYATDGSGCFDLYAATHDAERCALDSDGNPIVSHSTNLRFGTGLAFEIPPGHVMLVFSRSGHGFKHSTRLANCVGVIDADYRGEVAVKLTREWGATTGILAVKQGDRIAQALIVPYPRVEFVDTDELTSTERGAGGFGSTGA